MRVLDPFASGLLTGDQGGASVLCGGVYVSIGLSCKNNDYVQQAE
jgi:hypothetical protein